MSHLESSFLETSMNRSHFSAQDTFHTTHKSPRISRSKKRILRKLTPSRPIKKTFQDSTNMKLTECFITQPEISPSDTRLNTSARSLTTSRSILNKKFLTHSRFNLKVNSPNKSPKSTLTRYSISPPIKRHKFNKVKTSPAEKGTIRLDKKDKSNISDKSISFISHYKSTYHKKSSPKRMKSKDFSLETILPLPLSCSALASRSWKSLSSRKRLQKLHYEMPQFITKNTVSENLTRNDISDSYREIKI
jgi:hypothetical protein